MTPLRQRMLEDMQVRNLSTNTQRAYVENVARFALEATVTTNGQGHVIANKSCALGISVSFWRRSRPILLPSMPRFLTSAPTLFYYQ